MLKKLAYALQVSALWNILLWIWRGIGHIGNLQTAVGMMSGIPSAAKWAIWILFNPWTPLVIFVISGAAFLLAAKSKLPGDDSGKSIESLLKPSKRFWIVSGFVALGFVVVAILIFAFKPNSKTMPILISPTVSAIPVTIPTPTPTATIARPVVTSVSEIQLDESMLQYRLNDIDLKKQQQETAQRAKEDLARIEQAQKSFLIFAKIRSAITSRLEKLAKDNGDTLNHDFSDFTILGNGESKTIARWVMKNSIGFNLNMALSHVSIMGNCYEVVISPEGGGHRPAPGVVATVSCCKDENRVGITIEGKPWEFSEQAEHDFDFKIKEMIDILVVWEGETARLKPPSQP